MQELRFPKDFYWGCATAAHQVEGDNLNNDWWQAEQVGKVPHKSGKACDSYNLYEEDFDLAKNMANNAHRFSIEWSRVEPREGEFSDEAIEHYRQVLRALRERGLEPFVTLHHFTNPVWFTDKGGWENKESPVIFERYARYVIKNLGKEANYWITINEPLIYAGLSFAKGIFPPQKKSFLSFVKVALNMAKAHKLAYAVIKKEYDGAKVGIAKNNNYFEPYKNQILSKILTLFANYFWNKWFLNKINGHQDFVGINYYNHNRIHVRLSHPTSWFNQNENKEVSDFGWELYPEGIYHVTRQVARYKKPIYIFENGIADADDDQRPRFLKDNLKWLHKAVEDGADVKGYFHWSLLDNFEWAEGYKMKFGLVEVDFKTLERKPRNSYYLYKEICEKNGLNEK